MAKFAFRGRELIFAVILGGVLVPSTALAIPLYLLMAKIHLVGSYWSVLLPSMVSPFGVYLSRIYAASRSPDGPRSWPRSAARPSWSAAVATT